MVCNIVCGTLIGMGYNVVNIGLATTPTTELAVTMSNADGGIIITASHNPRQWNALKLLNAKGEFLDNEAGKEVLRIAADEDFEYADVDNIGSYLEDNSFDNKHIDSVLALKLVDKEAIKAAHFHVAVDAINSVAVSFCQNCLLRSVLNIPCSTVKRQVTLHTIPNLLRRTLKASWTLWLKENTTSA